MKQAQGFVTSDGRFFEQQSEAEYHEARLELCDSLDQIEIAEGRYVDPEKFIEVLTLAYPKVERMINAYKANPELAQAYEEACALQRQRLRQALLDPPSDPVQGNGKEVTTNKPYRGDRKNPPGVLEQPFGRLVPMPNVGRGEQPEELQDEC
jgi:hypothetical protein